MDGKATLICHDCQHEWAAQGEMNPTAGGDGLFTPNRPQLRCPECLGEHWGYADFWPDVVSKDPPTKADIERAHDLIRRGLIQD